jgi:hypothetical protein
MTGALCFIMLWLFTIFVSSPWPDPAAAQESAQAAVFRPEEIEQLVAPIAVRPENPKT